MEANVAVQLFGDAVEGGVRYSTYVGDDDSTTENRLQSLVAYDIEKWSDINHASRTLGSRLYAVKSKVKGLSPAVIGYMQRCFTYCIRQNKGKESSLLEGLKSIVPHAFGEHTLQRMVYIQAGPRKLQSWRPSWWKRSSGKFTICQSRMERCYLLPGARGVRVGFRTFYTFQDKSTIARE